MSGRATTTASASLEREWAGRSTAELLDHILERFHAPLCEQLDRLAGMVEALRRPGSPGPAAELARLAQRFDLLRAEVLSHMAKEEQVLFPWIRRGEGHTAGAPIAMMLREHRSAETHLADIETLANDLECRSEDCPALPALVAGLRQLRRDLEEHMALEDGVLFPRALQR